MVVRRPKSASKFNGTVIVEWYNVSQGHDGEYDWFQSASTSFARVTPGPEFPHSASA